MLLFVLFFVTLNKTTESISIDLLALYLNQYIFIPYVKDK